MIKTKKVNLSVVAIVALSIALSIALTFLATNAWFGQSQTGTGYVGTSGPIYISFDEPGVVNNEVVGLQDADLYPSEHVNFDISATVPATSSEYLLRARFVLKEGETVITSGTTDPVASAFYNWLAMTNDGNGGTWSLHSDGWYYLTTIQTATAAKTHNILVGTQIVPDNWTNEHAEREYDVEVDVQAVQAHVWNAGGTPMPTATLADKAAIFTLINP